MKYVFGPVASRRLGISLGIDVVPEKYCTLNCLYCQVGKTKHLTTERLSFFPPEEILAEVRQAAKAEKKIDYATFSGSGEPTLNADLGRLIDGVRAITHSRISVLTNATMLYLPEVRREVARADVVVPSLDAGSEEVFRRINRPHESIRLETIVSGIESLRKESDAEIWLEVMLVAGINDDPPELMRIKRLVERIDPHKIQLNTVVRPPQDPSARALSIDDLERIRTLFGEKAEAITGVSKKWQGRGERDLIETILQTVTRRSITAADLEKTTGRPRKEIREVLDRLVAENRIRKVVHGERTFYQEYY